MYKGAWESLTCDVGSERGSITSATFAIPIGGLKILASFILAQIGSPTAFPFAFSFALTSAFAIGRQFMDALCEESASKFVFIEQLIRLCYRVSNTRGPSKVANRLLQISEQMKQL